ncbi:DUF5689 domain-containing protein [Polaribacter sp.]|uniref:DUF5689 domain-containing protein n=1 Tax=Polaribacter sp. TaxID=1920175 RepID=UPI003F6CBD80
MNTKEIIIIILAFVSSVLFASCVEDGDFTVPQEFGNEENENLNKLLDSVNNNQLELKSISDIKALYISGNDPIQIVSDIVVKGYVISSDQEGNYFREFYMQDKPENPTAGIKVSLNLNDIYNKYNKGREIYIRLKNLYIGETNSGDGIITIGGKINIIDKREVESITQNQAQNHIYRSSTTEMIVPKVVSLGGINNEENIGTFVKIENAFFLGDVTGKTFIDPKDDFDTKRTIASCQGIGIVEVFLETSAFASFANNSLPRGGGSINAVVTKDFGGDFTVLVLNSKDNVHFTGSRCTPLSISDFSTILLSEDFESTNGTINISGWTNFRQEGTRSWTSYFDSDVNSRATNIGSFASRNASTITWLITNSINLDTTSEEYLSFETSTSFADGSTLEALISTNWDGNEATITTANWEKLPAQIATNSSNFRLFFPSTYISLSKYSGTAYIAFKYVGSGDEDFDGTYEIDNIMINAR